MVQIANGLLLPVATTTTEVILSPSSDHMAKSRIVSFSEVDENDVEMDSLECDLNLLPVMFAKY